MSGLPEAPNRRGALAWIALQNAATPTTIDIIVDVGGLFSTIGLTVSTVAELDAWARLIGAKRGSKPFTAQSGRKLYLAEATVAGWVITVRAHIEPDAKPEPLDDATRAQLQQLADDPDRLRGGAP